MKNKKHVWESKKILIKDLSLWDENARFPEEFFKKSEIELISYFLKKKEFKIENLAKEIVNEFRLPQLEKLVVLIFNKKYIVLEGNRRLTVYKLLINPSLSSDQTIKNLFNELRNNIKINENFKLESLVTTVKEEGLKFLDRKHNKGNNEISWGDFERSNFAIRRSYKTNKDVLKVILANAVKKLNLPDPIKEEVLGKGYVTNFYRIVESIPARKKLDFEVLKDGDIKINNQKKFDDSLKIIVFDIWSKKSIVNGKPINSRELNKKEAIEEYIKTINIKDVNKVDKEVLKHTKVDLFGDKKITKDTIYSKRKTEKNYDTLFLPNIFLPKAFKTSKLDEVFIELQKLKLSFTPTAASLLLRTLMELTVKEYMSLNKLIKVDSNGYIRTDSGKTKESLKEKIDYISTKFAPKEIQETVSIFNANSIYTENLNKIAHSRFIFASKQKVIDLLKDSNAFWEFLIKEIVKLKNKK